MQRKVLKLKKGTGKIGPVGKNYFWSVEERNVFEKELERKKAIKRKLNPDRLQHNAQPKTHLDFNEEILANMRRKGKIDRESYEKNRTETESQRKGIKTRKRANSKPFRVFEGGSGTGLSKTLQTIIDSEKRAPNREFVIADLGFSTKGRTYETVEEYEERVLTYKTPRWEEEKSRTYSNPSSTSLLITVSLSIV